MLSPKVQKYEYSVLDYRVVDGDTVATLVDLGYNVLYQSNCRLDGIDSPEHTTQAGQLVAKVLEVWLAQRSKLGLVVNSLEWDKFGNRFVGRIRTATVFENDKSRCLNDFLLENKLAKPFDGKHAKKPWTPEELAVVEQLATQILKGMGYYPQPPIPSKATQIPGK
jgi:endonuclease YncB( thermonuclease family)